MANHDRTSEGSTRAWRKLRASFEALLPLTCTVCALPVTPDQSWHLDHIVPRHLGGTAVAPAHTSCNLQKGGRMIDRPAYVDPSLEAATS